MFIDYFIAFVTLYVTIFYLFLLLEYGETATAEPKHLTDVHLPKLSVIIPVYNEAGVISKTLDAVLACNYPRRKLEVIVVDDESKDDTVAEVKRFTKRGVKLLYNKHRGIGKSSALNTGISAAHGELIATLDSDSFPSRDSLRLMVSYFANPSVMAATAAVKVHEPKNFLEKVQGVEYILTILSRKTLSFLDSVTATPGPLSVFRHSVFKQIGLFDENSILEDQEMAYRLQRHNFKIVSSISAEVSTQVPKTFKQLLRQRVRWNRGGLRNFYKYRHMFTPAYGDFGAIVLPLGLVGSLLVFAVLATLAWQIITGQFLQNVLLGIDAVLYGFNPLYVIGAFIFALSLIWIFASKEVLPNEGNMLSLPRIALYILVYVYFMTVAWIATLFEELFHTQQKW